MSLLDRFFFFLNDTATTESYTYGHTPSLHDALPISGIAVRAAGAAKGRTVRRDMHAGDPHLAPVDPPAVDPVAGLPHRARFPMRRVRSMIALGQAECGTPLAPAPAENERPPLVLARPDRFEHLDEIGHASCQ